MKYKPKLFCFTYAGGTTAFFDDIEKKLGLFDVVKMEYPGHGSYHKETCCTNFCDLADFLFREIKHFYSGGEYMLFGYSMGSITLTEVLKRILGTDMRRPSCVFLAAHEPYTNREILSVSENLDEWVKERTIRFGAVPEKLIRNEVFWRTYLPVYRADYLMIGKYSFEELELKTDIPAVFFYSETDTPLERMKRWEHFFVGSVEYHEYEG